SHRAAKVRGGLPSEERKVLPVLRDDGSSRKRASPRSSQAGVPNGRRFEPASRMVVEDGCAAAFLYVPRGVTRGWPTRDHAVFKAIISWLGTQPVSRLCCRP